MLESNFDIIIIGAGNAGLTLAAALPSTLRIAIIDHKIPPTLIHSPFIDGRKIALNYASKIILDEFNVWSKLAAYATPILQVHISQQGRFGTTRLTATENQVPALGYVITVENLNYTLQTHTAEQQNITWFYSAKLLSIKNNAISIQHEDVEKKLSATLIVVADGVNSYTRQLLNIKTIETDYEQSALVTRVKLKVAHHNVAYERFLPDGSLALLPLQENDYGVVLLAKKEKFDALMALSDVALLDYIQKNFGYRLGRLTHLNSRFTYPIQSSIAIKQVNNHCMLLGDAAHQMSPIAAQGFNLTLQDIVCLAELLQQHPNDIDAVLMEYEKERLPEQQKIINATNKLMKTFSSTRFPLPQLRSAGLMLLDVSIKKKRNVSELFMGLTPRIQKLVRKKHVR